MCPFIGRATRHLFFIRHGQYETNAPSSDLMRVWVDVIFTGAEGNLEYT